MIITFLQYNKQKKLFSLIIFAFSWKFEKFAEFIFAIKDVFISFAERNFAERNFAERNFAIKDASINFAEFNFAVLGKNIGGYSEIA